MGAPPCLLFFNALERGKTSVFRRFLEDVLAKQQGILYNGAIQSFRDGLMPPGETRRNDLCEECTAQ
jgi:hypothetical protein